jgi:hypothetical protein
MSHFQMPCRSRKQNAPPRSKVCEAKLQYNCQQDIILKDQRYSRNKTLSMQPNELCTPFNSDAPMTQAVHVHAMMMAPAQPMSIGQAEFRLVSSVARRSAVQQEISILSATSQWWCTMS